MPILLQTPQIMSFLLSLDCCHCGNKYSISSYNLFVLQADLYDDQLFIQPHGHIMKLASVDNLIRL